METWLKPGNTAKLFLLPGYCYVGEFRAVKRGVGVGLLHKSKYKFTKLLSKRFEHFELLDVKTTDISTPMRMLIVYRLNTSIPSFLCEFESLLDELTMVPGELIITGGFNLYCEIPNAPGVKALKDLLAENTLQQHVTRPTHKAGHTLDLVISRASSSIKSPTDVYDASISDHFSVLFSLVISDPASVPKVKLARDMRTFSYTKFKDDLSIKLNKIP